MRGAKPTGRGGTQGDAIEAQNQARQEQRDALAARNLARQAEKAALTEGNRALAAEKTARTAQRSAELQAATLIFQQGLQQAEAGAVDRGLFLMLRAWQKAPPMRPPSAASFAPTSLAGHGNCRDCARWF